MGAWIFVLLVWLDSFFTHVPKVEFSVQFWVLEFDYDFDSILPFVTWKKYKKYSFEWGLITPINLYKYLYEYKLLLFNYYCIFINNCEINLSPLLDKLRNLNKTHTQHIYIFKLSFRTWHIHCIIYLCKGAFILPSRSAPRCESYHYRLSALPKRYDSFHDAAPPTFWGRIQTINSRV